MINLIRAELLKIRSTQVWFWMLLLALAISALATIGPLSDNVHHGQSAADTNYYDIFTGVSAAYVAMLVIGILGFTTEFRHKTITTSVLATPNRWRLLFAKTISYALLAAAYAICCVAIGIIIAVIWLRASDVPVSFGDGVVGGIFKAYLELVLIGVLGLGLGALIRNQAASMVVGIVYFFVLNFLIAGIPKVRLAFKYTPGGTLTAFQSRTGSVDGLSDDVHLFSPWVGGIGLFIWAVGLLVLGGWVSLRRDIT